VSWFYKKLLESEGQQDVQYTKKSRQMNNSSKFGKVSFFEDPNPLILHSMNPARKRARTGDPDDPHVGPIMSSSISEPDTGTVQMTHTRAVLLNGHVVAEHVDLSRLREHIDNQ
jgi:hypothetical protein